MVETQESTRRWSGFVCPDCRFVFRVPRDHDGQGIVCPSCNRLLKIPRLGDSIPPLIRQTNPEGDAEAEEKSHRRRKRKRRSNQSISPDWESDSRQKSRSRKSSKLQWGQLAAGATLFLSMLGIVIFFLRDHRDEPPDTFAPGNIDLPMLTGESTLSIDDAAPAEITRRPEYQFVAEAEGLVRRFLNAKTTAELLEVIDRPEEMKPRLARMHPEGRVEPVGIAEYNISGQVIYHDPFGTLMVRTRDFLNREITVREYPDGLKVDWESWVGWSDMAWSEFMENPPTTPQIFRVRMKRVDYYNFGFTEDQWESYRIESPDGEHSIHGYAERGSLLYHQLLRTVLEDSVNLTLELAIPEEGKGRRQVVIQRIVAENWIPHEQVAAP